MPTTRLTAREREVLESVERHYRAEGLPPTYRVIAAELGLASRSTVYKYMMALLDKGYVYARELRGGVAYFPVDRTAP